MSKIFLLVLIFGVILLGVGIAIITYNEDIMMEEYPDLVVFFDGELTESQMSSTPLDLLEGDTLTITIVNQHPPHKLFFSLEGPEKLITETFFSDSISFPLASNSTGTYMINIANPESQTVNVFGLITETPVYDTDFIKTMSSFFMLSIFLIFLGGILIIISIFVLIFQKIRPKNNLKNPKESIN